MHVKVFKNGALTKFKGWSPLLIPLLPSSESEVRTSELAKEGPGEFEGVDFLVERSKGCSLWRWCWWWCDCEEGRLSSLGSSWGGLHLEMRRGTKDFSADALDPDPGDFERRKRLPGGFPLECKCGGFPSRRSRARLFWNQTWENGIRCEQRVGERIGRESFFPGLSPYLNHTERQDQLLSEGEEMLSSRTWVHSIMVF